MECLDGSLGDWLTSVLSVVPSLIKATPCSASSILRSASVIVLHARDGLRWSSRTDIASQQFLGQSLRPPLRQWRWICPTKPGTSYDDTQLFNDVHTHGAGVDGAKSRQIPHFSETAYMTRTPLARTGIGLSGMPPTRGGNSTILRRRSRRPLYTYKDPVYSFDAMTVLATTAINWSKMFWPRHPRKTTLRSIDIHRPLAVRSTAASIVTSSIEHRRSRTSPHPNSIGKRLINCRPSTAGLILEDIAVYGILDSTTRLATRRPVWSLKHTAHLCGRRALSPPP